MYMHIFMNIYTHVCYIHYHTHTHTHRHTCTHRKNVFEERRRDIMVIAYLTYRHTYLIKLNVKINVVTIDSRCSVYRTEIRVFFFT